MAKVKTTSSVDRAYSLIHKGNLDDVEYAAFIRRMNARFVTNISGNESVFVTDADLWEDYLGSFSPLSRQFHNCSACRHFITRYGGLAIVDAHGRLKSAVWNYHDAEDTEFGLAVDSMALVVENARIIRPFLSSEMNLGHERTGEWTHLYLQQPRDRLYHRTTLSAGQAMAAKREDFLTVTRALAQVSMLHLEWAVTVLETDALYRSEKVLGQAKWLRDLKRESVLSNGVNRVWKAVAAAPAGFCHPRSSMVGTLLEDLANGMDLDEVKRRFDAKMHPLRYQRPTAPPKAGNVLEAERIVRELEAGGALARRFARLDEVQLLWSPSHRAKAPASTTGVFSSVVPRKSPKAKAGVKNLLGELPPRDITWRKFSEEVLPDVSAMEVLVPAFGNFVALTTAVDPLSRPILQWDSEDRRNPVGWYMYSAGSDASQWKLVPGWTPVAGTCLQPSMWNGGFEHQGKAAILLIPSCRDTHYSKGGLGLFPEILRSEFHGVRATVEAYSRGKTLAGYADASACGLIVTTNAPVTVRVTLGGVVAQHRIDRWD